MGDFDPSFVHALATQSWSLYGVGMFLILLRVYARIHRLGIKGLQMDDFCMILAGCLYTILIVCLNVIAGGGGSNLYEPDLFETFTPENIKDRIHGSKIVIVSEQAMLNVIYCIKACMLLMYTRLTLGLQVQRLVLYLAIYVAMGWLATEIAFFTACRPFSGYWAMPPPNPQCTTLQNYAIVQACFNISSDTLMLFIPLPLITRLNVPWKQKGVLLVIFSMGIFVVAAAILTKVFNLSDIWDPSYMLWYTRESSVAIFVSNLPMIWPLLREWFPALKALTPGQKSSTPANRNYSSYGLSSKGRGPVTIGGSRMFGGKSSKSENGGGIVTTIRGKGESMEELSSGDETELVGVQRKDDWDASSRGPELRSQDWDGAFGIHKHTTVQISEEHIEKDILPKIPQRTFPNRTKDNDLERGTGMRWDLGKGRGTSRF